jgi:hypothetical protein
MPSVMMMLSLSAGEFRGDENSATHQRWEDVARKNHRGQYGLDASHRQFKGDTTGPQQKNRKIIDEVEKERD